MQIKNPFGEIGLLNIGGQLQLKDSKGKLILERPFLEDTKRKSFRVVLVDMEWRKASELSLLLKVDYRLGPLLTQSGHFHVRQRWIIVYGDNGVLFKARKPFNESVGTNGASHVVQCDLTPEQPDHEAVDTWADLIVSLVAGYEDDGFTVGYGPFGGNVLKEKRSSGRDFEFNIQYRVTGKPEKVDPITLPEELLQHTVLFDKENDEHPSAVALRRLEDKWIDPLRRNAPELYAAIKNGECHLILQGYASTTSGPEYNQILSMKRIFSVSDEVKRLFGIDDNKVAIVTVPRGDRFATRGGKVPGELRVEIIIDRQEALRAVAAAKKKIPA